MVDAMAEMLAAWKAETMVASKDMTLVELLVVALAVSLAGKKAGK